ncbi:MAG: hypothetical protein OXE04_06545 [bacterium]|nr:hypothetical protein [bacterium]
MEGEGVALSSPIPSDLPKPIADTIANPAIVLMHNGENDIQPLYFIPWIPGIQDTQDDNLHSAGLRELTARLLTYIISKVGRTQVPNTLTIDINELLSAATFGVFGHWRDSDRKQFCKAAATIVERTLKSVTTVQGVGGSYLEIDLPDNEIQKAAIDRLEQTDPANPTANLEATVTEQPTLFKPEG